MSSREVEDVDTGAVLPLPIVDALTSSVAAWSLRVMSVI